MTDQGRPSLREALETVCRDSLESTVDEVRKRQDDGEITVALQRFIAAYDALVYIGHFASQPAYMETARTLHYDMAGKANEALTGLLQGRMPPREPGNDTVALHE